MEVPRPSSSGKAWKTVTPIQDLNIPSRITNDLGVASRRILQLRQMSDDSKPSSRWNIPFVKLDFESTGIGKHIVISSHPGQDSINRTKANERKVRGGSGVRLRFILPSSSGRNQHAKLGHNLNRMWVYTYYCIVCTYHSSGRHTHRLISRVRLS